MLSIEQINDLHRLYWSERWPIRKIERHLHMGWHTIRKYLDAPAQGPAQRPRTSKLDPFKTTIAEWLEKDATVTGTVIEQRVRPLGYTGGPTILRDYLQTNRPQAKPTRAFIRMEPTPGERFEVDWGHFGALDYSSDKKTPHLSQPPSQQTRQLSIRSPSDTGSRSRRNNCLNVHGYSRPHTSMARSGRTVNPESPAQPSLNRRKLTIMQRILSRVPR